MAIDYVIYGFESGIMAILAITYGMILFQIDLSSVLTKKPLL